MQVLQDRGESGSRHGRATFAVLLLQYLAVVVLLMLIPLLAPGGEGGSGGGAAIARALGLAVRRRVFFLWGRELWVFPFSRESERGLFLY